jgi:F-type H+-transporting ATPase subunit b
LELNWSTFLLEIVNFLVLVWLLKRFFYQPVLDAIGRRRAGVEQTLRDAEELRTQAEALQEQYQNRLAAWEQERELARTRLAKEIQEQRTRQLATLSAALEKEREKARVLAERRAVVEREQAQEKALAQGAEFAARLLSQAASPELEGRLLALLVDELEAGTKGRLQSLRAAASNTTQRILVTTAYPLSENDRQRLERSLSSALGVDGHYDYEQDPRLLAGLRVNVGAWVLGANLEDELKAFAESAREA